MEKQTKSEKLKTDLIEELSGNRPNLYKMLKTVSSFREKIEMFLPEDKAGESTKIDFRSKNYNKFAMQEQMKHVTGILLAELDIHRAIEGSIKTEFDLRAKAGGDDEIKGDGSFDHIRTVLKNMDGEGSEMLESLLKVVANKEKE